MNDNREGKRAEIINNAIETFNKGKQQDKVKKGILYATGLIIGYILSNGLIIGCLIACIYLFKLLR